MNDGLRLGDPVLLDRGAGAGGWIVGMDDTYVVVDSGVFNIQVLRETVVLHPFANASYHPTIGGNRETEN